MSIEGASPSIVQAQAIGSVRVFDALRVLIAQDRENVRGAALGTSARKQEVGLRAALLFLDAERLRRSAEAARRRWRAWNGLPKPRAPAWPRAANAHRSQARRAQPGASRERLQFFESDGAVCRDLASPLCWAFRPVTVSSRRPRSVNTRDSGLGTGSRCLRP
jgi:hypothetical protein